MNIEYHSIFDLDISRIHITTSPSIVKEGDNVTFECTSPTTLLQTQYRWANSNREVFAFGDILHIKNFTAMRRTFYCEILGIIPNTEPPLGVRYACSRYIYVYCNYLDLYKNKLYILYLMYI